MTEDEREELIEKMANAIFSSRHSNGCYSLADMARAALAVAEPVIREECANDALKRCFFCPADVAAAIWEGGNKDE